MANNQTKKDQAKWFKIGGVICLLGNLLGPAIAGDEPTGTNYIFMLLGGAMAITGFVLERQD